MISRTALGVVLLGASCSDDSLYFDEEPRPCEELKEACPAPTPFLLELADMDRDGVGEFVTVGLGGAMVVSDDHSYEEVHVWTGWSSRLTRCSSGNGFDDLVLYKSSDEWWTWGALAGNFELQGHGQMNIGGTVNCFDLGLEEDVVVELDDTRVLRLLEEEFELQGLITGGVTLEAGMVWDDDAPTMSFFLDKEYGSVIYVVSVDLAAVSVLDQVAWSFVGAQVEAVEIVGSDLILAMGGGIDGGELLVVHDVDPTDPMAPEGERIQLPWRPALLKVAELDGSPGAELVVAPMPVTSIAVSSLTGSTETLELVALEVEAVDVASGDLDGDGKDEVYVLDPRQERIIQAI